LRVAQQIPVLGHELSELANPLEAGAAAGVDFEKGCYIGQEVIARLDSYNKVQRRLARLTWQIPAPGDIPTGGELRSDGKNAGFVTTHVYDPRSECFRGLGLIRIVFAEQGTSLQFDQDGHEYSLKVDLD
jgi:folate-binding protein YgfZ